MKRSLIVIDESKCDGCGLCANGCPEGALQIVDGKARLVGEGLCDGLGACIGECPRGAIEVVEKEAEPYDEARVMANIAPKGANVIAAHLKHLSSHGQTKWHAEAVAWLKARDLPVPAEPAPLPCGCPGSAARSFGPKLAPVGAAPAGAPVARGASALSQWPVQLHLVNPRAQFLKDAKLLIAASCTAFACGSFHADLLAGKALVIACPKLDDREGYAEKIRAMVEEGGVASIEIAIMEVPCCSGLLKLVKQALEGASRQVSVEVKVVSIEGGSIRSA